MTRRPPRWHDQAVGDVVDLLARPTYGFKQVDRIIGLKPGTAARWIDGYDRRGRHHDPIIRQSTSGDVTATWGEFVETRLIAEYREAGVSVFHMRPAIEYLREV